MSTVFGRLEMCPEQDSNLHVSQHSHLKRARLPFRHLGSIIVDLRSHALLLCAWSGKRDSNSRPRPWQGRALPTELLPHCHCLRKVCFGIALSGHQRPLVLRLFPRWILFKMSIVIVNPLIAVAKVRPFFEPASVLEIFFRKKCIFPYFCPLFTLFCPF